MKPENRALLAVVVAVIVLISVVGAVIFLTALPTRLPIPAGTVVRLTPYSDSSFTVRFTVAEPSGRLVGRWFADRGGVVTIHWANRSDPYRGAMLPCIILGRPWHGTANVSLVAGDYIMEFSWFLWDNITVEQSIQLVYPGEAPSTNQTLIASLCGSS